MLEQVEGAVVGLTQPLTGFDYLVEDGLDTGAAGDVRAEDAADRALLFAHVLELAGELGVVRGNPGHPPSFRARWCAVSPGMAMSTSLRPPR